MLAHNGRLLGSSSQQSEYRLIYSSGVPGNGESREPLSLYTQICIGSVSSPHGPLPLDISHSITPRLNISELFPRLYELSFKDAGSLYAGAPSPRDLNIASFNTFDKPKSVIFATPDLIRILLDDYKTN